MSLKVEIVMVTPFQQNCSVIWCSETKEAAVIDAGGDIEQIMAVINKHSLNVKQLLLTHGHLDHAGGAKPLSEKLSVPIIGPGIEDKYWLDDITTHSKNYGMTGMYSCTPDQWLQDKQQIHVGKQTLDVYHCPGHTPGHVIFHNKESHLAFVGDVLFKGSIGRTDFPGGDHATLLNSIKTQLWPLGGKTQFISGHGEISDFKTERANNPFVADSVLGT